MKHTFSAIHEKQLVAISVDYIVPADDDNNDDDSYWSATLGVNAEVH